MSAVWLPLTESDVARARKAGYSISRFNLEGNQGYLVDKDSLEALMTFLGYSIPRKFAASGLDGIESVASLRKRRSDAAFVEIEPPLGDPVSRQAYIEACAGRLKEVVGDYETKAAQARQVVSELQNQLTQAIRQHDDAAERLEAVRSGNSEDAERFGREFDILAADPRITEIRFEEPHLVVYTKTILCRWIGTEAWHRLGRFQIFLNLRGSEPVVRWKNLDGSTETDRGHFYHPHIPSQGNPCFGNSAEVIASLMEQSQYAECVRYAIQFLESANKADNWGRQLQYWPEASQEEVDAYRIPSK